MKQFSGNFWWTTADYYAGLRASTQMNKDYLGAIQCCFFMVEAQAPGNPLNSIAGRCPLHKMVCPCRGGDSFACQHLRG